MNIIRNQKDFIKYIEANKKTKIICSNGIGFYENGLAVAPVEVNFNLTESTKGESTYHTSEDFWGYKDKWNLTKHGLDKISNAIGLAWESSRQIDSRIDENGRVTFYKHEVTWKRPTTSGIDQTGVSTGEYNYFEDLARLRHKEDIFETKWVNKKPVKTDRIISKKGDPQTDQIERRRNYAGSLAETNAKVRALNEALPELPRVYTIEDIRKPLIVFRVVVDLVGINEQNPALMQAYHAKLLGLGDMIYGQPMNNQILIDQRQQEHSLPEKKEQTTFEPPKKEIETETKRESKELTDDEINKKIEELILSTAYNGKAKKAWKNFDPNMKLEFMNHLETLAS